MLTRRTLLTGASGIALGTVTGTADAAPKPRKGRTHTQAFSDEVGMRDYAIRVGAPSTGGAQSAVTLTAIDGETISGGVQSNWNSNGWFTRRGMTRSTAWTGPKPGGGSYAGFDDVNFIPAVTWLTDFSGTSFYDRMDDLGLNGMIPAAGSVSLTNNVSRGKFSVVVDSDHAGGTISSGDDPGVIGVSTGEEPSLVTQFNSYVSAAASWLGTSDGAGRFHLYNFADNLLNGDIGGTITPADMLTGSPNQFTTCDQYWFAGAPGDEGGSQTKLFFRLYTGASGTPTTAQTARGSHYGSMMDSIRKNHTSSTTSPFLVWVENGAPYTESTSGAITAAQLKWAVWSTLTHGARGIAYFNHTFRTSDPLAGSNNFNDNGYGGPGVTGTGIYAAAKEVNINALGIASVINSPFDGYFVYGDTDTSGSIATAGFLTAVTSTNSRSKFAGVDASCKWQPSEQKHYILATTREPGTATNIPVTFRMVDQGQTTAVRLHDTTGSISISRGGSIPTGFCEFSDTFAAAASYKTYRID